MAYLNSYKHLIIGKHYILDANYNNIEVILKSHGKIFCVVKPVENDSKEFEVMLDRLSEIK